MSVNIKENTKEDGFFHCPCGFKPIKPKSAYDHVKSLTHQNKMNQVRVNAGLPAEKVIANPNAVKIAETRAGEKKKNPAAYKDKMVKEKKRERAINIIAKAKSIEDLQKVDADDLKDFIDQVQDDLKKKKILRPKKAEALANAKKNKDKIRVLVQIPAAWDEYWAQFKLSPKTIADYSSRLYPILKLLKGSSAILPNDLSLFRKFKATMDIVDNTKNKKNKESIDFSSKLAIMIPLASISNRTPGLEDIYHKYFAIMTLYKKLKEDLQSYNIPLPDKRSKNSVVPDWKHDVMGASIPDGIEYVYRVLFYLYSLIPPLRIEEYKRMRVISYGMSSDDPNTNYCVLDKKGHISHFVIQTNKNSRHRSNALVISFKKNNNDWLDLTRREVKEMGFNPSKLADVLENYIDYHGISMGEYLFPIEKSAELANTNLDPLVTTSLSEIIGKHVTSTGMRKSFVRFLYSSNKNEKTYKLFADFMDHTTETARKIYNALVQADAKDSAEFYTKYNYISTAPWKDLYKYVDGFDADKIQGGVNTLLQDILSAKSSDKKVKETKVKEKKVREAKYEIRPDSEILVIDAEALMKKYKFTSDELKDVGLRIPRTTVPENIKELEIFLESDLPSQLFEKWMIPDNRTSKGWGANKTELINFIKDRAVDDYKVGKVIKDKKEKLDKIELQRIEKLKKTRERRSRK